jgi:Uma2 family endonuclease
MNLIIDKQNGKMQVALPGRMDDREFFEFCMQNPELSLERDARGNILVMEPVNMFGGRFEIRAATALDNWNDQSGLGIAFSSNTGFTLPNGAVRSPDASWIAIERYKQLPQAEKEAFAHICPDFVLEIRSKSDSLDRLQTKMREYMANGARLGFLIDPIEQQAFIYRPDSLPERIPGFEGALSGEPVLPGFSLPLGLFESV